MIAPSRDHPSPHDWPEDWADPAEDNGSYLHVCGKCSVQFIGHKRRVHVCKVCASSDDIEANRRRDLLAKAGLNPEKWVLTPREEWTVIIERLMTLIIDTDKERALRRELADALRVADSTNSNVAYWGHPGRHRDTSEALLAESAALDESLKDR